MPGVTNGRSDDRNRSARAAVRVPMEFQQIEVDSIADLRIPLEDEIGPDAVSDIAADEVLLEPEGEALDEAGDLECPDAGTPSRTADSVSVMAGTSPSRTLGFFEQSFASYSSFMVRLARLGILS